MEGFSLVRSCEGDFFVYFHCSDRFTGREAVEQVLIVKNIKRLGVDFVIVVSRAW